MPKPLAICIEDLDASKASKYLQCVALPGRQPGLRLDETGRAIWFSENAVACELWVSADDRLILYRPEGAPPVKVRRAGRSLDVPFSKPVIIMDKDEVDIGARHLRIHIHGNASAVAAPTPLVMKPGPFDRLAQTAAAAAVIGTLATGCIEVRETPPVAMPITLTPTSTIEIRETPPEPVMPSDTPTPTIEVRETPPVAEMPTETPTIEEPTATPTPEIPTVTPTIEVRDFPPTAEPSPATPVVEGSVAWALQGPWTVTQVYNTVDGQKVFSGTLMLTDSNYSFVQLTSGTRPDADGDLNFLFDNPQGSVTLDYVGIHPKQRLRDLAPVNLELAHCTFYAGSIASGEFEIILGGAFRLYFWLPSSAATDWQITR